MSSVQGETSDRSELSKSFDDKSHVTCINNAPADKIDTSDLTEETHDFSKFFTCDICQKPFKTKKNLTFHQLSFHKIKPFKCPDCNDCFSQSGELSSHLRSVHKGKSPYKCDLCNKSFISKKNLNNHILNYVCVEKREMPPVVFVNCRFCLEDINKSHLIEHLKMHATTKTNICNICNKNFLTKCDLNVHMYTHKPKKYVCDVCQRAFTTPSILKNHAKLHTLQSLSCEICNRTFTRERFLKQHYTIHTGSANKCDICRKTFVYSTSLQEHYNTHFDVNGKVKPPEKCKQQRDVKSQK